MEILAALEIAQKPQNKKLVTAIFLWYFPKNIYKTPFQQRTFRISYGLCENKNLDIMLLTF